MFLQFLFIASIVLLGLLSLYALFLLWITVYASFQKKTMRGVGSSGSSKSETVAVLIPCFNEGEDILETIHSLEHQSFARKKDIFILIKDEQDSSLPFIQKKYGKEVFKRVTLSNHTSLTVVKTGLQGKREKLDYFLPQVTVKYTAFLDADHVAAPHWIERAVTLLGKSKETACAVQARRAPKKITHLFQILDSAQNHIGNELLNIFLSSLRRSVFFTGTTAIFKSSIFQEFSFPDCITEDTALSYDLFLKKKHILYDPQIGSYESVSPTIFDYIARRRRWANGHNRTFFQNIKNIIFKRNVGCKRKLQLFLHGIFFLMPILGIILINIFQGFVYLQYGFALKMGLLLGTIILTGVISDFLVRDYRRLLSDSIVGLFWVLPFVLSIAVVIFKFGDFEFFNFIINFPYLNEILGPIQISILFVPLLVLLFGAMQVRIFSWKQVGTLILAYPAIIFFDIYAVLLGFVDYCLNIQIWRQIKRNPKKKSLFKTVLIVILAGAFFSFLGLSILELSSCENRHGIPLEIQKQKSTVDGRLDVILSGKFSSSTTLPKEMTLLFDARVDRVPVGDDGSYKHVLDVPMGFDKMTGEFRIPEQRCGNKFSFTNTLRGVERKNIIINGEPFLVKGVVPSFAQPGVNISFRKGLEQIKSLGANMIRTYHVPTNNFVKESEDQNLLIMAQSRKSNWNTAISKINGISGLFTRYEKLYEKFKDNPYIFALNLGNEIEINNRSLIPEIDQMLKDIKKLDLDCLTLYSTFFPFVNYSGDILGVNMLDTGETYWRKAIPIHARFGKPFVATELGGFEAFYERTDPAVRSIRLKRHWNTLLSLGGSGAIIFQSHDNWAQPVVIGYNNPFQPEEPDDLRGLWDHKNNEKLIARTVRALFSDMEVNYLTDDLFGSEEIEIEFVNKRQYSLSDIRLLIDGDPFGETFSLDVDEKRIVSIPNDKFSQKNEFQLDFITHRGLVHTQQLNTPVLYPKGQVFFPNIEDIGMLDIDEASIHTPSLEDEIEVFIPDGWELKNKHESFGDKKIIKDLDPYKTLEFTQIFKNGRKVQGANSIYGVGDYAFTFEVNDLDPSERLVLEGLGSWGEGVKIVADGKIQVIRDIQLYREKFVPLAEYISPGYTGEVTIVIHRMGEMYLTRQDNPENQTVTIDFKMPKLFKLEEVLIEKKN